MCELFIFWTIPFTVRAGRVQAKIVKNIKNLYTKNPVNERGYNHEA
jgi:hypothetical protein